ncbi:hypothetical protein ACFL2P_03865 [Candidatus Moduliflexota bacterium]
MKKWHINGIMIIVALALTGGCENSVSNPVGTDLSFEDGSRAAAAGKKPMVTICHETGSGTYRKISVNENALQAHMNHGDLSPGTEGLDENCRAEQVLSESPAPPPVAEKPCPCFGEADLAALDITFGGSAWQMVGEDDGSYTNVYGLFFGSSIYFRAAEAGQTIPGAPYSCKLLDETALLLTEITGITPAESESCRQMIRNAWPNLF